MPANSIVKLALTGGDVTNSLLLANAVTEAPGSPVQGLPALFLNQNFSFDKDTLLSSIINTLATSPQMEKGVEDLYTNVPQAARLLETARQNPIIRSRILGTKTEPFLTSLENKLKSTKFNKEKAQVMGAYHGTQQLVDTRLKDQVMRTKAMQDYIVAFNEMAKGHRGSSEDLNRMVMAKLLKENKEGAEMIAPITNEIISRNQMKPGLARVHGNVDRVRFKNMVRDLGNRYSTDRKTALDLSQMAKQVTDLGSRLENMAYYEKPIEGPRLNIRKLTEALTGSEDKNMGKTSGLRELLIKNADMNFLLNDVTPAADVPKGRIIRSRNFDEKGGIQGYVENRRSKILSKRGFNARKDEEDTSPNSLVKYILMMDKE